MSLHILYNDPISFISSLLAQQNLHSSKTTLLNFSQNAMYSSQKYLHIMCIYKSDDTIQYKYTMMAGFSSRSLQAMQKCSFGCKDAIIIIIHHIFNNIIFKQKENEMKRDNFGLVSPICSSYFVLNKKKRTLLQ